MGWLTVASYFLLLAANDCFLLWCQGLPPCEFFDCFLPAYPLVI
jgi:hypothetical protein